MESDFSYSRRDPKSKFLSFRLTPESKSGKDWGTPGNRRTTGERSSMSNGADPALVFLDAAHPPADPGTHALIIGVGQYTYGKGANVSPVGGDLPQLSSPPISA